MPYSTTHGLGHPAAGEASPDEWPDSTRTSCVAYASTCPHTRRRLAPYGHRTGPTRCVPYRHQGPVDHGAGSPDRATGGPAGSPESFGRGGTKGPAGRPRSDRYPGTAPFGPGADNRHVIRRGRSPVERGRGRLSSTSRPPVAPPTPASHGVPGRPGRGAFRPGAHDEHVTPLGKRLVEKGFGTYGTYGTYGTSGPGPGPGPRRGEWDRRNAEAFQRAQGRRRGAADGYPGPETRRRRSS